MADFNNRRSTDFRETVPSSNLSMLLFKIAGIKELDMTKKEIMERVMANKWGLGNMWPKGEI